MRYLWRLAGCLFICMLLAACRAPASGPQVAAPATPTLITTAAAPSPRPTTANTPAVTQQPTRQPAPSPSTSPTLAPLTSEPFFDCDIHPSLPACSGEDLPIGGRLAFIDSGCKVHVIELATGNAWQSQLPITPSPETSTHCRIGGWSPQGNYLLTWGRNAESEWIHVVYRFDGTEIERTSVRPPFTWSDQETLETGNKRRVAADGREAWFERLFIGDSEFAESVLYIKSSEAVHPRQYRMDAPLDERFGVMAWVAGDELLLGQSHFISSGAMLTGGFLIVIDPDTGKVRELGIRSHADQETLDLHPTQDEIIAVVVTQLRDSSFEGACSLLQVNLVTDQHQCIEQGFVMTPRWSPDGSYLAYSVDQQIRVTKFGEQTTTPLVTEPADTKKAVFRWVDNDYLLYFQYHHITDDLRIARERNFVDVRVAAVDGSFERVIATNIAPPKCYPVCNWSSYASYYP